MECAVENDDPQTGVKGERPLQASWAGASVWLQQQQPLSVVEQYPAVAPQEEGILKPGDE